MDGFGAVKDPAVGFVKVGIVCEVVPTVPVVGLVKVGAVCEVVPAVPVVGLVKVGAVCEVVPVGPEVGMLGIIAGEAGFVGTVGITDAGAVGIGAGFV